MKRIIAFFICMFMVAPAVLSSCGPSSGKNPELPAQAETKIPADSADVSDGQETSKYGKIDVDLSSMSGTVAYSQVYNMMYSAKSYVGKVIRMAGPFSVGYSEETGKYYPSVIIKDATACCAQGLEFELRGAPPYPEGYPELSEEITVTGVFQIYYEGKDMYIHITDAVLG